MSLAATAIKAVTIYQSVVTVTNPVTVAGLISTNATKDWLDYLLVIGSVGSVFVGLLAVWLSAKWSHKEDLVKRYSDIVISVSQKKFQGLTPLVNQMYAFLQTLELGVLKSNGDIILSWNVIEDERYRLELFLALKELRKISRETLELQSVEFQPLVEVFICQFDRVALDDAGKPMVVALGEWENLISFQKDIVQIAGILLGLETNRSAMNTLDENDPEKFWKLLEENSKNLKEQKIKIKPFVDQMRAIYKNCRKKDT